MTIRTNASPERPVDPTFIPGRLNMVIAACSCMGAMACLWVASHRTGWLPVSVAVVTFSFLGNTIFSCLHEAVHGNFHKDRRINEFAGIVCGSLFPTGLSLQRAAHLGHHARNRSEFEMFDYYEASDNRLLKVIQWYGIISGIYWSVAVLGSVIYLLCPFLFTVKAKNRWSETAEHTSGPAYLRSFAAAPPVRARLELLFSASMQLAIILSLHLTMQGWLLCYLAFGLQWSALQYADHAFSELHVVDGAWDLRVNPVVQAIFLNYHLHLAHHRNPAAPWISLPSYVDANRHRPRFIVQYLKMWLGPRPLPLAVRSSVTLRR